MRKIFTLILGVLFASGLIAQNPEAEIKKTDVKPVIDGVFDDVWATTDSNAISRIFYNNPTTPTTPTLGDAGQTYWKALWDADGFYLIVNVADDNYFPNYAVTPAADAWQYDKPEIYFDVNYVLRDGAGPSAGNGTSGHLQVAPDMTAAKEDGLNTTDADGTQHAFKVENPGYVAEYFVPWTRLKDKEGIMVDKTAQIGFDVMINDNDESTKARNRAIWGADNTQGTGEAWVNMDESGIIMLQGAEAGVQVEGITLTGGAITTNDGTLQIVAEILPVDADLKDLKWTIAAKAGSAGRASISSTGVVTGILDGVMVVNASSTDGSFIDAEPVEVTISGQVATVFELSYLKNGEFNKTTATNTPVDWSVSAGGVVTEGVMIFGPDAVLTDPWSYTLAQRTYIPFELKDMDYIISFKAWADEPRTLPLVLEDAYDDGALWDAYCTSSDPTWSDKTWTVNLTTEPTVYSIFVNLGIMKATTLQNLNFQVGKETPKIHLDSMYMVSVADMALVPVLEQKLESFKIYPNPADTKLHISLTTENTTVAIYNSVGVKMEEVVVPGTQHTFDVSRYTRGLYIVKANNSVMKFVK